MALSNLLTFFVGGGGVLIFFICWVLRVSSGTGRQSQDSSDKCLKSDCFDNVKACKSLPFIGCVWRGPNGLTLFYTITALCLLVWIAYETFWAKSCCHRNLLLDLGLPCSNEEKKQQNKPRNFYLWLITPVVLYQSTPNHTGWCKMSFMTVLVIVTTPWQPSCKEDKTIQCHRFNHYVLMFFIWFHNMRSFSGLKLSLHVIILIITV